MRAFLRHVGPASLAGCSAAAALSASSGPACGPKLGCEAASPAPTTQRARVVLFGDSLTQNGFGAHGWVSRVADVFSRRADVLNRGYSGYNTRWARPVLEQLLSSNVGEGAVLWAVWLGANDAAVPSTHRQHVPVAEYEENLKVMIRQIQSASPGRARIVVLTPPAVDDVKVLALNRTRNPSQTVPDRTDESAGRYAAAARRAAAGCGVDVLDVRAALHAQEQPPGHFLSDGLHFNDAGQELVARLLVDFISERFPDVAVAPCKFTGNYHNSGSTSKLPQEFPWHDSLR